MSDERESGIHSVPISFEFVIELYKEVANLQLVIQSYLEKHGFVPVAGQTMAQEGSKSLVEEPLKWLLRSPERYFYAKEDLKRLLIVKCVMFENHTEYDQPHVVAASFDFGKEVKELREGGFETSKWAETLAPYWLNRDFDSTPEGDDTYKGRVSRLGGKSNWKGYEDLSIRFFKVPFVELVSSRAVEKKVCDRLLGLIDSV